MATVHVHKSGEQGIFANAYIVDTGRSVVVVDGTLTVSEARTFGARPKSMTKPLKAIAQNSSSAGHNLWLISFWRRVRFSLEPLFQFRLPNIGAAIVL